MAQLPGVRTNTYEASARQEGESPLPAGTVDAGEMFLPHREVSEVSAAVGVSQFGARQGLHQTLIEVHSFLTVKAGGSWRRCLPAT